MRYLVLAVAATVLSWNLWNLPIASGYIDPIMRFGAQDEATYTREAITMVRDGGWMTPTFLGRWVFEKPPLLMWLSAVSMKIFGIGRWSARLPAILAGALICMLCFVAVERERSLAAGIAAAALAMSSQILFTMSRHNMTDILLAAASVCAVAILMRDPELQQRRNLAGFVVAAAAGMVAKSLAGLLILAVTAVVTGLARRRFVRAAVAIVIAILLASPWFLYNFFLHRDWFLADMGYQIITIGSGQHQTSPESHLGFYFRRILNSDPLSLVLVLLAAAAVFRALRRREPAGLAATSYLVLYFAALMVFRFHSQQYLCWFVPSLILIAGLYSPLLNHRIACVAVVLVCAAFLCHEMLASGEAGDIAAVPALSRYCGEHRAADLYVLDVDDEFYSAVLPLHHVRYGWMDAADIMQTEHPYLAYLGILIPADKLDELPDKLPEYRDRLRAWGLNSTEAIATGLPAHRREALRKIIDDHPESDFLVSSSILPNPEQQTTHRLAFAGGNFALLESKQSVASEPARWTCAL